jgi:hypothetical protein
LFHPGSPPASASTRLSCNAWKRSLQDTINMDHTKKIASDRKVCVLADKEYVTNCRYPACVRQRTAGKLLCSKEHLSKKYSRSLRSSTR